MSRKCPDCGHWNDDELTFCEECGEPIDPQTRLIMELEGKKQNGTGKTKRAADDNDDIPRTHRTRSDDDDDYIAPSYHEDEKKKSPIGWILLLAVAAAAVYFLFLR